MEDHPNKNEYLYRKFAILCAFYGALRISELAALTKNSILPVENGLMLHFVRTKTDKAGVGTSILLPRLRNPLSDPVAIYEAYLPHIKTKMSTRLFLTWDSRMRKYKNSPIGVNQLHKLPSMVAQHNNLPDPGRFTGHSFRVSCATALADGGMTITNLKRHGGWKSDSVVEGYLRESKKSKQEVVDLLTEGTGNTVVQNNSNNTTTTSNNSASTNESVVFQDCIVHGNVYIYNAPVNGMRM